MYLLTCPKCGRVYQDFSDLRSNKCINYPSYGIIKIEPPKIEFKCDSCCEDLGAGLNVIKNTDSEILSSKLICLDKIQENIGENKQIISARQFIRNQNLKEDYYSQFVDKDIKGTIIEEWDMDFLKRRLVVDKNFGDTHQFIWDYLGYGWRDKLTPLLNAVGDEFGISISSNIMKQAAKIIINETK